MRFRFGSPPETVNFDPDRLEWHPLKEPSPWLAQFLALPIGIAFATGLGIVWIALGTVDVLSPPSGAAAILIIVLLIPVHELLHVLIHPGSGRSRSTIVGFWASRLLFYARYDDVIRRNRFIVVLVFPFAALSTLPLCVSLLAGMESWVLAFSSIFNGLLSCVDLLGALLLVVQVPKTAMTRNKGYKTYWKLES